MRRVHVTTVAVEKRIMREGERKREWVGLYVYVCVCADALACERVALLAQHAKHIRHIVISNLSGSTTFFHIIS